MKAIDFSLKYGKGTLSFSLPGEQLLYELAGNNQPPPADLAAAYRTALDHPIDSPPLREIVKPGEQVVIIVSDITRSWQRNDLTLPLLVDYLNEAGIKDENITVIIAVGAHRPASREEIVELCTDALCRRIRVVNHNAWDTENIVYYGKTSRGTETWINRLVAEADRVILTGGVIYHYMVGYGGGRKSIMPGVAALKTIRQCHLWAMADTVGEGTNPLAANMKTTGNPGHEDMMEVAAFVKADFLINVVPNLDGDITGIFAGNWVSAWTAATRLVDRIFGVRINEQADIVIASTGGHPKDISLYQAQKTIDNAIYAMKTGGVMILLADCPDIGEPREFFDWFKHEDPLELERAVRENFLISGWVAFRQLEYRTLGTMIMVTRPENIERAGRAGMQGVTTIDEALRLAAAACGNPAPKITVMPHGANTFPILVGKTR